MSFSSLNEVNDTFPDCSWYVSLLARFWDCVLYWFESFSCADKGGGSFDFALAVKTCCCSGSFKEVEVPSLGSVVSGVDADVVDAKEF